MRCPSGKKRFSSVKRAASKLQSVRKRHRYEEGLVQTPIAYYRCPDCGSFHCGSFHLTSRKQTEKAR